MPRHTSIHPRRYTVCINLAPVAGRAAHRLEQRNNQGLHACVRVSLGVAGFGMGTEWVVFRLCVPSAQAGC